MKYFSASFYYFRYSVFLDILRESFSRFQPKLWLFATGFGVLFLIHQFVSIFFRLLDEIFHRGHKKTVVREPVFIIANPRSGTTYLHRLLALDAERFVYTKNAHTFFMTSSFVQFYMVMKWIDTHLLWGVLRKTVEKLDELFWGGWDDIHPMGFNKAEEDELVFAQTMNSPGMFIPFPFFHLNNANVFLDHEPDEIRQKAIDFYESSVKRFLFRAGKNKTYLAKNVMSTGRLKTLLEKFPDAKIIYIARHPYDAVPSMVSMFTQMYGKSVDKKSEARRVWAEYGIRFFQYSKEMRDHIPTQQFYAITFDNLLNEPQESVRKIYAHFGWQISASFAEKLSHQTARSKSYQSAHEYSLEEYGLTKEEIYEPLSELMTEFGFSKEVAE